MINESDKKSKKEETKEWIRKREQRKGNGKIIIMRFYENNLIKPLTSYLQLVQTRQTTTIYKI